MRQIIAGLASGRGRPGAYWNVTFSGTSPILDSKRESPLLYGHDADTTILSSLRHRAAGHEG